MALSKEDNIKLNSLTKYIESKEWKDILKDFENIAEEKKKNIRKFYIKAGKKQELIYTQRDKMIFQIMCLLGIKTSNKYLKEEIDSIIEKIEDNVVDRLDDGFGQSCDVPCYTEMDKERIERGFYLTFNDTVVQPMLNSLKPNIVENKTEEDIYDKIIED